MSMAPVALSKEVRWHRTMALQFILIYLLSVSGSAFGSVRIQYQSPLSGATLISRESNIIIRPSGIIDRSSLDTPSLFEVRGTESGIHPGKVILSDDEQTVMYVPDQPFSAGEIVSVLLHEGLRTLQGEPVAAVSFRFTVAPDISNILKRSIPQDDDDREAGSQDWSDHFSPEKIVRRSAPRSAADSVYP